MRTDDERGTRNTTRRWFGLTLITALTVVILALAKATCRVTPPAASETTERAKKAGLWATPARPYQRAEPGDAPTSTRVIVDVEGEGEPIDVVDVCVLDPVVGKSVDCESTDTQTSFEVPGGRTYVVVATSSLRSASRRVFVPLGAEVNISLSLTDVRAVECTARDVMGGEIAGATFLSAVGGVVAGTTGRGDVPVRATVGEILVTAPGYAAVRPIVDANGDCVARLVPASAIFGTLDKREVPETPWSSISVRAIPAGGAALLDDPVVDRPVVDEPPEASLVELRVVSPETAIFRIDGLSPGAYRIAATGQDATSSQGTLFEVGVASEVDAGTVGLVPQRGLVGRIRHGAEPCLRGTATLTSFVGSHEGRVQQGVARFASVPTGLYDLDVTCESPAGHRRIRSGLDVGQGTREFEVDLAEDAVIRVRVLDGAGRPVAGAIVSAREFGLSSLMVGRGAAVPVGLEAVTDSNGDAELRGAVIGVRYRVSTSSDPSWSATEPASIHLDSGQEEASLTLFVRARVPDVEGVVTAQASDVPVPALELHFIPTEEIPIPGGIALPRFMRGVRVESAVDGRFSARLSEGGWELEARDWTGAEVRVTAGKTFSVPTETASRLAVEVDLSGTFAVAGQVRDVDGLPARDVVIVGLSGDVAPIAEQMAATEVLRRGAVLAMSDEKGRFLIDSIRAGAKVVAIDSVGRLSRPAVVKSAGEEVLLELQRVWSVSFEIPKRLQGLGIRWCLVGRTGDVVNALWDRGQTTGNGLEVSGLPKGEYSVLAQVGGANELARLDFTLPGTTRLPLPFRDPLKLVGRLVKHGEPLVDWLVGESGICFDDGAIVVTDTDGAFTLEVLDPLPHRLLFTRPQTPEDRGLRIPGSLPLPSLEADVRVVELGDLEIE